MKVAADISRDKSSQAEKRVECQKQRENVHRKVLLRMAKSVIEFYKE